MKKEPPDVIVLETIKLEWIAFYEMDELCDFCSKIGKDAIQSIIIGNQNRYTVFYWTKK